MDNDNDDHDPRFKKHGLAPTERNENNAVWNNEENIAIEKSKNQLFTLFPE